jgi:NADH-quinone oxidoreductase subunit N
MLFFTNSFLEEFFLLGYILGGILFCSFVKYELKSEVEKKKIFFFFCQVTLLFLLGFFVFASWNLWTMLQIQNTKLTFFDSISWNTFYYYSIQQPYDTTFFRKDLVTTFFLWCLTGLVLFYFYFYITIQKTTTQITRYFLEFPILLITIFFSLRLFLYTYDLILVVLTLELTSFCTVVLISLPSNMSSKDGNVFPLEAAIKYFLFNAIAISLFLFALGHYYALTKSLNLFDLGLFPLFEPGFYFERLEILLLAHFLFFSAYLIKLGAVPFHQWVPDVYEGAEILITAFLILVLGPTFNFKLFVFIKLLLPENPTSVMFGCFLMFGCFSIVIGTFYAFLQVKLKRFLAYTGITHLGYILISLGTGTLFGFFAGVFYLFSYILTNCVFFSLIILSKRLSGLSLIYLNQLKPLFTDSLLLFFFFLIPIFSFAGFPPFMGFFSKFFTLFSLLDQSHYFLVLFLLGYILISAYLYLRFIKIGLFEQTKIQTYLPLRVPATSNAVYYKLYTASDLQNTKQLVFSPSKILFFILFLFNSFLFLFMGFLPFMGLLLQQPLLLLFLLY